MGNDTTKVKRLKAEDLKDLPPLDVLQYMRSISPPAVQGFIDEQAAEVLMVELPKLKMLIEAGPTCDAEYATQTAQMFTEAMDEDANTFNALTATVRACAVELAEVIDRSVKRVLLEDTVANRQAALNLTSNHARLTRCLVDIAITPEQAKNLAELKAERNDADRKAG